MAFEVYDNDPYNGYISWFGVHIVYKGVDYAIQDGNTNARYVYWVINNPYIFQVSNDYPSNLTDDDVVVFLNKNGTHVTVPNSTVIDGSLIVPESILTEALSANCVTGEKILAGSISADELATGSVVAGKIAAGAVAADKIAAGAVTSDHINANGITANKITSGQLSTSLVEIVGTKGYTKLVDDGIQVYDPTGDLKGQIGWYDEIGEQNAVFYRQCFAYDANGAQVGFDTPRYAYGRNPAPIWHDTFDTDMLDQYTSIGYTPATWSVASGVLIGTGGSEALLLKNNLLLKDFELEATTDQSARGLLVGRYQDINNCYYLAVVDNEDYGGTGVANICKRIGGGASVVGSVNSINFPRGIPQTFKMVFNGSTIEAWHNGVKIASVIDTSFTGGAVGLRQHAVTGETASRILDFKVFHASQGVLIEEYTTNLVTTNQASIETDLSDIGHWSPTGQHTLTRDTSQFWTGTASAKIVSNSTTTQTISINTSSIFTTVTPGSIYTFSAYAKAQAGAGRKWLVDVQWFTATGVFISQFVTPLTTATAGWTRLTYTLTAPVNAGKVFMAIDMYDSLQNEVLWVDGFQIEQKPFATSWQMPGGSRWTESLTFPTAGILSPQQGTIELVAYIDPASVHGNTADWVMPFAVVTTQQSPYAEFNQIAIRHNAFTFNWTVSVSNAAGSIGNASLGTITTPGMYNFTFKWISGVGGYTYLNGTLISSVSASYLPTAFNTTAFIGSWDGNVFAHNRPIIDLRISSIARSDTEIAEAYNSGQPLPIDENTSYKLGFDGHLKPSLKKFGLRITSGDIGVGSGVKMEQDGLKVYDASNTLRTHLGQYTPGNYGLKVIGGEVYSSTFRTSNPGVNNGLIELTPNGTFRAIGPSGKAALQISAAYNDQGMIEFYDSSDTVNEYAQIYINGTSTKDLLIKTNYNHASGIKLSADNTGESISLGPVSGMTSYRGIKMSRISADLLPYESSYLSNPSIGSSSYKWFQLRAYYVTSGDMCFEEKECAICGQPFQSGDVLHLLVHTIHDEHGTMTIPIHDHCKGKQKVLTIDVPETEEQYYLDSDGEVKKRVTLVYEELDEDIVELKPGYFVDEKNGRFMKKAFKTRIARDGIDSKNTPQGIKFFERDKEVTLDEILEEVEIYPETEVDNEEATRVAKVKRRAVKIKKVDIEIGKQAAIEPEIAEENNEEVLEGRK